ncbi:hydroquinone glucosyltransferase-like [Arachis stenosperma]|uniref:hydroquinone glucosyltransferase-like n=1 Tax=Arachis stenosperma TaxID=217475 RepID=UPI0025AC7C7A|nr:hydroquinone glucosyltransferase-like [Arachis stenosperma]
MAMEQPKAATTPPQPLVVMMPTQGMGHLIPMIEFAKRLVRHRDNLRVKFIIPTDSAPTKTQNAVLRSLPSAISHTFLPPVSLSDYPFETTKIETIMALTILRSFPSLRSALHDLITSNSSLVVSAFVVDLFGTDAFDVAAEFNIPRYIFYPSTATCLSFFLNLPKFDQSVQCEFRELAEPIKIPGCVPIHGRDLLDPVQDRSNDAYKWVLHIVTRYREADGIIQNSFMELEPGPVKELLKDEPGRPPFYPVGPLVNLECGRTGVEGEENSECLKWLDEQPAGSVLFVSFGSGGTLSSAQIDELAHGLEMSEQRFLWVVRSPNDKVANASYFSAASQADPLAFLPKGFLERTKGRGFVVLSWAPQPQILAHESTGGFLSHCGWNSTLESVVNGVPFIAWPLFAEQKMNAVLLAEEAKVALRPKVSENGLVERAEIASVVKCLMEGEEGKKLRYRMKDLKEGAERALSENGSSTNHISHLALKWSNYYKTKTTALPN